MNHLMTVVRSFPRLACCYITEKLPASASSPAIIHNPSLSQNERMSVHMHMLALARCAFALVRGPFLGYHIYLIPSILAPSQSHVVLTLTSPAGSRDQSTSHLSTASGTSC